MLLSEIMSRTLYYSFSSKRDKDRIRDLKFEKVSKAYLESRNYLVINFDNGDNKLNFESILNNVRKNTNLKENKNPDHLVLGRPLSPATHESDYQIFDTYAPRIAIQDGSNRTRKPKSVEKEIALTKDRIERKVKEKIKKRQTKDVVLDIRPLTNVATVLQTDTTGFDSFFTKQMVAKIKETRDFHSLVIIYPNNEKVRNSFRTSSDVMNLDNFLDEVAKLCDGGTLAHKRNFCVEMGLQARYINADMSNFTQLCEGEHPYEVSDKAAPGFKGKLVNLYERTILPIITTLIISDF